MQDAPKASCFFLLINYFSWWFYLFYIIILNNHVRYFEYKPWCIDENATPMSLFYIFI